MPSEAPTSEAVERENFNSGGMIYNREIKF